MHTQVPTSTINLLVFATSNMAHAHVKNAENLAHDAHINLLSRLLYQSNP